MSIVSTIKEKYKATDMAEFLKQGPEAESKEEYLAWVAEWKSKYRELSRDIRELKKTRKEYVYKYREKGDDTSKRRTIVGDNPLYDGGWDALYLKSNLRDIANWMLQTRAEAKIAAGKRMEAARQKEAA